MNNLINAFKLKEEFVSTFLSILAVVMVATLLFNYFRSINKPPGQTTSAATEQVNIDGENSYKVKAGDSLWSIAEENYGSGYKWTELYAANKDVIADPSVIEIGTQIKLIGQEKPTLINEKYTVISGDSLWKIAQEKCGDGFAWTKIASENQLANPQVIHAGNVLNLRCK